jgi:hypothetical protein
MVAKLGGRMSTEAAIDRANECVGEAFARWPCTIAELADEAERILAVKREEAALARRRNVESVTATGVVPDGAGALGNVTKRDAPKRGRKSKVRRGTARLRFDDLIVHTDTLTTPGGLTRLDGAAIAPARDWVEAAVRAVTAAKLARFMDREALPRDQPAGTLEATPAGFVLKRTDGVIEFVGALPARHDSALMHIKAAGFGAPPWFTDKLFAQLVECASFASGSRGQLSVKRMAELLREPHRLRQYLAGTDRARYSPAAKRVARSLPRKPRAKKGLRKRNRA